MTMPQRSLLTLVLDGRSVQAMHGVEGALGRTPRDFTDYACRTAATGVWEGAP